MRRAVNAHKRRQIFERLKTANPAPGTELRYASPFQLLVAVILSAQATDRSVNQATPALFAIAPDAHGLMTLGETGIGPLIRHIGLYRTKARHLAAMAHHLLQMHNGQVPESRAALEALPGVGRKTANVVLNTAFGQPTIAVDTHIFRVSNRTRLAAGATVSAVEQKLLRGVPEEYRHNAHHWLILHGRYTCMARQPQCSRCIIADLCEYPSGLRPKP